MVRIFRNFTPVCLNATFVSNATKQFVSTGASVWALPDLKRALLNLTSDKCAYCEADLLVSGNYMEVEHFADKHTYPNLVLNWENLLPACKRCNVKKGTHDVIADPIVNPAVDDPTDHLAFRLYRFVGKTQVGAETIDAIGLNNTNRAVLPRFRISEELLDAVDECIERLTTYRDSKTTRNRNRLVNRVDSLLDECQPCSVYGATCATVLHSHPSYEGLRSDLQTEQLWNASLQEKDVNSAAIMFDVVQ